jgi:hypothetical protein
MEKQTYNPEKKYNTAYVQALVDLYIALRMEYQGLSPEQLEKGLENVDPQWLDEIQLSPEWEAKHRS